MTVSIPSKTVKTRRPTQCSWNTAATKRTQHFFLSFVFIAFLNFAAIFSNIISITQSVADHLLIFQEALRPTNDVQYVIEQYRTGAFVPMPTLYNNFYHGSGLGKTLKSMMSGQSEPRANKCRFPTRSNLWRQH